MGGKGKAPPAPNYAPIAAANKEAAEMSAAVAREQLAWAKEQYALDKVSTKEITDVFMDQTKRQDQWAQADRARYEEFGIPLEEKMAREAATYDTPEKRAAEAARQVASTNQQFEANRQAQERQLASYGIDPGQIRAGAADAASRAQQAATSVAAAEAGRRQVENVGSTKMAEAVNVMRGLPAQSLAATQSSVMSGQAGIGGNLAQTASGAQTMGTGLGWAGNQANVLGNWGRDTANMYGANLQYRAATQSNPWQMAGQALGMAASFIDKGGAIPERLSPSGGAIPDDVPARVTVGEYVLPKDVVERKGTEFFDRLIEKTRNPQAKGKAPKREAPPPQDVDPDEIQRLLGNIIPAQPRGIPMQGGYA